MNLLREYIRVLLSEATKHDTQFKTLMDAGYDGIKQAMQLADHLDIPSQELPWGYKSVDEYLSGRLANPDHKTYDPVKSTNYYLEPTGWEFEDLQAAAKKALGYPQEADTFRRHAHIRESLLTEAAFGLTDFRKRGYYVGVEDMGESFSITLYDTHPGSAGPNDGIGEISAEEYDRGGAETCMGAYMINWSSVEEKGWGPLLYDLAMELATSKGTGLMSDRNNVSYKAQNVWRYYMANRGNVEKVQMDDWDNNLTDPKSDNCDQEAAYQRGIKGGTFWESENEETPWDPYGKEVLLKSPTTKMYRWKGMSKINALKKMGRWLEVT